MQNNDLAHKIQTLMNLGRQAVEHSDSCKAFEPSLTVSWRNDGSVDIDFYSYCLDLEDGGRHHNFLALNEKELLDKLDNFISVATQELKLKEEENL